MKKYYITVNGKRYAVEVEEVKGDFEAIQPEPVRVSPAIASEEKAVSQETVKQEQPKAEIADKNPESAQVSAPPASAAAGEKIECPMPGTIVKINVSAGSSIKKGEVLLVLEAMKMENEIMAPRDCKIITVNIAKGSAVNTGDTLLTIE